MQFSAYRSMPPGPAPRRTSILPSWTAHSSARAAVNWAVSVLVGSVTRFSWIPEAAYSTCGHRKGIAPCGLALAILRHSTNARATCRLWSALSDRHSLGSVWLLPHGYTSFSLQQSDRLARVAQDAVLLDGVFPLLY
jgi:hypothetical protein